jgi:hypothetical protein
LTDDPEEKRMGRRIETSSSLSGRHEGDWSDEDSSGKRRAGFREVVLPSRIH